MQALLRAAGTLCLCVLRPTSGNSSRTLITESTWLNPMQNLYAFAHVEMIIDTSILSHPIRLVHCNFWTQGAHWTWMKASYLLYSSQISPGAHTSTTDQSRGFCAVHRKVVVSDYDEIGNLKVHDGNPAWCHKVFFSDFGVASSTFCEM